MITERIAIELASHEAIVQEAYKDSVGVWTWGIGVTDASGHKVSRYIDKPSTIERCFEVYEWLLREKYLPGVRRAFGDHELSEHELGAALSFHYNTGAIGRATWVKQFLGGDIGAARASFMAYRQPKEIIPRRKKERDLFFDRKWSNDGTALLIPVRKPSYLPDFRNARRIDIQDDVRRVLG
ncbi:MAG: hypothetical protein AAFO72_05215 [Pseudomonadota bacterium]